MMNKVIYIWILLAGLLAACNDDPEFPDPGLDATSNVRDTVRRDTIDVYYLEMRVKAPNGVNTVQVLNGLNYTELDRLDEYAGQTDFLLRYAVDLTEITDCDTTLNYIIKVVDNNMRSYNKAFSVVVKRFSAPTITVSGVQGTLGLVSPVFELKAFFETGLHCIHSYKVIFEGTTLDEGILGDTLSEYNYSHVCNLDMQKGQDYHLTIQLTDTKGVMNEEHLTLNLIEMQHPIKVIINTYSSNVAKLNRELEFYYNPEQPERLDSICGIIFASNISYVYSFEYTDWGVVKRVVEWRFGDKGERVIQNAWTYTFDDQQRLTGAFGDEESKYDLECTDWHADGRVKYFGFRQNLPVTSEVAWQTSASGEAVMASLWVVSGSQCALGTKMTAVTIPSYLPALPPFLPLSPGNVLPDEMQTLLQWQYGFEQVHQYVAAKGNNFESYYSTHPKLEYAYVTNTNGRLEKILKRTVTTAGVRNASKEFMFIYE